MWDWFECTCKCITIIFTIIWTIAAIFTAVLVAVSVGIVDLNEIGLKFDTVNYAVDNNTVYLPGRYWLGLGTNLINFQTTWSSASFKKDSNTSIAATTNDPTNVYIELTLMYRIRPEFSHFIYVNFPDKNYSWFYNKLIVNSVQNLAQNFSVANFTTNRRNLSQSFASKINLAFRENYAEVMAFQLGHIGFDDVYENFLLSQAITKNEYSILALETQKSLINANSNMNKNQKENTVGSIISSAINNASIVTNNAIALGEQNITITQLDSLRQFVGLTGLNFTSVELNKLLLYDRMYEMSISSEKEQPQKEYSFNIGTAYFVK